MQRTIRAGLICAALFGVPSVVSAGDIAGASDPAFAAAPAQWLADEERPALAAFAGLARDDNRAAQVLLGLIDKTPSLQGPWLSGLDRAERMALLRTRGGMSGHLERSCRTDRRLCSALCPETFDTLQRGRVAGARWS